MAAYKSALIVGTGPGLSASLARLFAREGLRVAVAARRADKLAALASETGASTHVCDATDPAQVAALFAAMDAAGATPDLVVYNASGRSRGPIAELVPAEVERSLAVSAFGAFLVAQQAAKRMLPNRHGAIALTGATAGVKGFALSAPFAMGKFALRGLAQSPRAGTASAGHPRAACRGRRRHPRRTSAGPGGPPGQHARPRRDRADVLGCVEPAPQRLDMGDRRAAVGGEVLAAPKFRRMGCACNPSMEGPVRLVVGCEGQPTLRSSPRIVRCGDGPRPSPG